MDLLSDLLRDLRLESTVFCLFELRAPWGLRKDSLEAAPFHVVIEGRCWLQLRGEKGIELATGDLVVLPHGDEHTLSSSKSASTVPFKAVLKRHGITEAWTPGKRVGRPVEIRHGSPKGEIARVVSGVFAFRDPRRNPVLDALPRVMRVACEHGRGIPSFDGALRLLIDEAFSQVPGAMTVVERAADIVFVQAVRAHIASTGPVSGGWLRGLLDPQIGRALSLVHARPAQPWTIASLARQVGLSRTIFAERFRRLVGDTVMAYVTGRRMHVASGLLCTESDGLAHIARQVGYASEVAFSKAFRAWADEPPGRYRRRMRAAR
ncbi:MAG TPA: AraC family transcriptional regulator [Polyangiaceae bacterium]|nr:AraC family transcriptional regulator [Polyangiaceae bacterium]